MKKLFYLLSLTFLFGCASESQQNEASAPVSLDKNYIAVYDFHTDHRCESCLTIEKLVKETLREHFQKELDDSTIVFSLINVDAPENAKMAEDYEAFGTSLMIEVFNGGEEDILDMTEWAFEAIHGDKFKVEFREEIDAALKKL